jgi:hypothetical protein
MRVGSVALLFVLAAHPLSGGVEVVVDHGQVDLTAEQAPLAAVLDALSERTGMTVVYEEGRPSQLISTTLAGRTPAEAVLAVLAGQNLNYALVLDREGKRVETLLLTGTAPVRSSRAAAPATRPQPRGRRPQSRPSPPENIDEPEPDEDEFDEGAAQELEQLETPVRQRRFPRSPFAPGATPQNEAASPQFPVSPFAPRAPTRPGVTPPTTLAPGGPVEQ